jgi:hypothetical protein
MISFNNQQIICIMNNIGHLPIPIQNINFHPDGNTKIKSLWYIDISICLFNVNHL